MAVSLQSIANGWHLLSLCLSETGGQPGRAGCRVEKRSLCLWIPVPVASREISLRGKSLLRTAGEKAQRYGFGKK